MNSQNGSNGASGNYDLISLVPLAHQLANKAQQLRMSVEQLQVHHLIDKKVLSHRNKTGANHSSGSQGSGDHQLNVCFSVSGVYTALRKLLAIRGRICLTPAWD